MQQVYQPLDSMQAAMLLGMLISEGIQGHLQGEHLLGAMGELPALGLLSIWVADGDAARARELIRAYEQAVPCSQDAVVDDDNGLQSGSLQC